MPVRPFFSKVGLTLVGVLATATVASAGQAPIAVGVAPLFVGEEKIVEGVVTAVEKDVNVVTLRLGTPPQSLTVSLIIGLLTRFPTNPEVYFAGKTVMVGGIIKKFRNELEMTIRDPARIEVVDLDLASDPKLREQQEAMRAKVQSLEERIRQLEADQQKPQGQRPPE
jgi:hypothetical protein